MRIAILSDIHGNADALAAVLDDLAGRSVDATLCLGDHLSGAAGSAADGRHADGFAGFLHCRQP